MSRIVLIVKTTDGCNLRCKYCYNSETGYGGKRLSHEHFKKLLETLSKSHREIVVVWHGGEPLICGIEYFEKAIEIENEIAFKNKVKIENQVQSNGTLIDEKWVKFFKKHKFKIGLSYDGIHNETYRGCSEKTLAAMSLLKKNGLAFGNIAVVVDGDYNLIENYEFFKEKQIPVEFSHLIQEGAGKNLQMLSAQQYSNAMIELFDKWVYDKSGVGVRLFVTYIILALGGPSKVCDCDSCHGKYLCIDTNGDLYNCSRHTIQEYVFGNIENISTTEEIFSSEGFKNLLVGSIKRRTVCKETCEYFDACKGGCADIAMCGGSLEVPPEYNCYCFKTIFPHIKMTINEIFEKKIPLSELNPAIRKALIERMGILGGSELKFMPENL